MRCLPILALVLALCAARPAYSSGLDHGPLIAAGAAERPTTATRKDDVAAWEAGYQISLDLPIADPYLDVAAGLFNDALLLDGAIGIAFGTKFLFVHPQVTLGWAALRHREKSIDLDTLGLSRAAQYARATESGPLAGVRLTAFDRLWTEIEVRDLDQLGWRIKAGWRF